MFFIVASVVANGFYYAWWPSLFGWLMPIFATIALPLALALFAEEFGAEVKREKRAAERDEPQQEAAETPEYTAFASKRELIQWYLDTEPGLTQSEIAQKAGASPSYVSEIVRGGNHREPETERRTN